MTLESLIEKEESEREMNQEEEEKLKLAKQTEKEVHAIKLGKF